MSPLSEFQKEVLTELLRIRGVYSCPCTSLFQIMLGPFKALNTFEHTTYSWLHTHTHSSIWIVFKEWFDLLHAVAAVRVEQDLSIWQSINTSILPTQHKSVSVRIAHNTVCVCVFESTLLSGVNNKWRRCSMQQAGRVCLWCVFGSYHPSGMQRASRSNTQAKQKKSERDKERSVGSEGWRRGSLEEWLERQLPNLYEWSPVCKNKVCLAFIGRTGESLVGLDFGENICPACLLKVF